MPKPDLPTRFEVLFTRDGDAWRLYAAGWVPPYVRAKLDTHREARVETRPDFSELDAFMFESDAPYVKRMASDGGAEIECRGRSAVVLGEWIDGLLSSGSTPR